MKWLCLLLLYKTIYKICPKQHAGLLLYDKRDCYLKSLKELCRQESLTVYI